MNIERKLPMIATYWSQGGQNIYGAGTYNSPTQLPCRWEDTGELFIDKTGQEVVSRSKVYFAEDIDLEGYLALGISMASNPTGVVGAFEIRQVKRTPDLRNVRTLYVAFL